MSIRVGSLILLFAAAFAGFGVFGDEIVSAQQATGSAPAASPTPPIEEEEEIVKVDTETVNVLFVAQDRNRKLLTTLRSEDIRVLENGQVQEITGFSRQVDLPLSLAILIDTSASQERTLPEEKAAAISFVESVVRPTKDEVSVISFTGESTTSASVMWHAYFLRTPTEMASVMGRINVRTLLREALWMRGVAASRSL